MTVGKFELGLTPAGTVESLSLAGSAGADGFDFAVAGSPQLGDGFVVELVRMSPPNLNTIQLKGSDRLSQFVVTPDSCFPSLKLVDLSSCTGLECVLIQSSSLEVLDLSHCTGLKKVVLQCPNIRSVSLADCTALQTLTIPEGGGKVNLDLANCPLDSVGSRVLD